ncbi:MAG: relaxase/mobilization nuclease domain-containing protein [Kiloniellaceae bacterium]
MKVIGWSKTQHSARNQAFYITRTRESDNPSQMLSIENENGARIEGKEEIETELASWDLAPAAANRSKAWQEAAPEERADMKADQALNRRQSAHLIFSVPAGRKTDAVKLHDAVRAGLAATLGAQGHRYVFAIHTDHSSRPHAHIVVKARGESYGGREKQARQLRLNPADLDALRQVLTTEARSQGLDVVATRRVDRARTREEIAQGQAPLRENQTRGKLWRAQTRQGSIFEAKAPNWYARHGLAYEMRRLRPAQVPSEARPEARPGLLSRMARALRGSKSTPAPSQTPALFENQALRRLDARLRVTHADPQAARDSFAAMYREAPRLATWAMNHHPEAFGLPTGTQARPFTGRGMKAALQAVPAPNQASTAESDGAPWQADALRRRQSLAQAQDTRRRDAEAARRHLEAFAGRIERGDPSKKALVEEIRSLVRGGTPERAKTAEIQKAVEKARKRHPRSRGRGRDGGIDR